MTNFEMVQEFHKALGTADAPIILRLMLLVDEVKELTDAIAEGDKAHILKEVCDVLYLAHGVGMCTGGDVDEAFKRVHESNMLKTVEPLYRKDGKLLKGPNYVAPTLEDLV